MESSPPVLKSERVKQWQESAGRLLKWYEENKRWPDEPVQVEKHYKIVDLKKFIETQRGTILHFMPQPFNRCFYAAYYRLLTLKNFLDEQFRTVNSKP